MASSEPTLKYNSKVASGIPEHISVNHKPDSDNPLLRFLEEVCPQTDGLNEYIKKLKGRR